MGDIAKNPFPTDAVETPDHNPADLYFEAQRAWDSRMTSVLTAARRSAILNYVLAGALSVSVVSQALLYRQKDIQAFLIPEENSELIKLTQEWAPSDGARHSRLKDLIEKWRSFPLDRVLHVRNQNQVARWVDQVTFDRIKADAPNRESKDWKGRTCNAIDVAVANVQPIAQGLWQVRWEETCFASGKRIASISFTGAGGFAAAPPTTVDELRDNPLGLILTNFTWVQDYARSAN